VRRLLHVSTGAAIKRNRFGEPVPDESQHTELSDLVGIYEHSKFLSERAALAANGADLEVVVTNLCAPIGERDVNITPAGSVVRGFLLGKFPMYTHAGLGISDVRDVVAGMVLACEKGKPGERYILGGHNLMLKDMLDKLAAITGLKSPTMNAPYALAFIGALFGELGALFTGREPLASMAGVRTSKRPHWFSSEKARRELGYTIRPIDEALTLAVGWFSAHDKEVREKLESARVR
jgi:dihydroflavonol-4-reductase